MPDRAASSAAELGSKQGNCPAPRKGGKPMASGKEVVMWEPPRNPLRGSIMDNDKKKKEISFVRKQSTYTNKIISSTLVFNQRKQQQNHS